MIVVADTSPLNYLIQIDCERLLPRLYGRIFVPPAVLKEMEHPRAPVAVSVWLRSPPAWIDIATPSSRPNVQLLSLGPGELEAIQLARERNADLLLMDERKGRLEAARLGLSVTGTLGVLLAAGRLKLIDPREAYRVLTATTTFRTSDTLEVQFLRQIRSD